MLLLLAQNNVFVETKAPTETYGFVYLFWTNTTVDNLAVFRNIQDLYDVKQLTLKLEVLTHAEARHYSFKA